jgi:hypothetical protein
MKAGANDGSAANAINADLVDAYVRTFMGYGSLAGAHWFIGLEQGGGNGDGEMQRRLAVWHDRGRRPVEDVFEYHLAFGETRWFNVEKARASLQPTWSQLARVALAAMGRSTHQDEVRQYQANQLGRAVGETCLLECLALPNANLASWHHSSLAQLPYLKDRPTFRRLVRPGRLQMLFELIDAHRPPFVICYGGMDWWARHSGIAATTVDDRVATRRGRRAATTVFLIRHPTARWKAGEADAYFNRIGELVRLEKS